MLLDHDASRVIIEITEHAPVTDYTQLRGVLHAIRQAGARIAIDDAGAGYASLRHILRLEPEIIKLDRELTEGIAWFMDYYNHQRPHGSLNYKTPISRSEIGTTS